jgi:hypothetical protein
MRQADWWPDHAARQYTPPEPGQLLAFRHAVYRVVEVRPIPQDRWSAQQRMRHDRLAPESRWRQGAVPVVVVIRPVAITGEDPRARDHDLHLSCRRVQPEWWVYHDEHYPVCAICGEPTPCRERLGMRIAAKAMARMARYEQPGVCPSCAQPVTPRQKSFTYPDNIEIPGGPAVTFHVGRRGCRWAAAAYETRWIAADPQHRQPVWSCTGNAISHSDGTYQCSAGDACPGPLAEHAMFAACQSASCRKNGPAPCRPAAGATRR